VITWPAEAQAGIDPELLGDGAADDDGDAAWMSRG
jgi:hypothetical protein